MPQENVLVRSVEPDLSDANEACDLEFCEVSPNLAFTDTQLFCELPVRWPAVAAFTGVPAETAKTKLSARTNTTVAEERLRNVCSIEQSERIVLLALLSHSWLQWAPNWARTNCVQNCVQYAPKRPNVSVSAEEALQGNQ